MSHEASALQFAMRCLVTRTGACFDVAFQPEVDDLASYLGYPERFARSSRRRS